MSHDLEDGGSLHRRTSALEEAPTILPPGFPGLPVRRRSTASRHSGQNQRFSQDLRRASSVVAFDDDNDNDDIEALTKSVSAISTGGNGGRRRESQDNVLDLPVFVQRPRAAKAGLPSTIREVPSNLPTPASTRPPSPVLGSNSSSNSNSSSSPSSAATDYFGALEKHETQRNDAAASAAAAAYEAGLGHAYPDVGTVKSWRGTLVLLVTCGAQLMDGVSVTSVNIALPAIQQDLGVANSADLQWLISAYTLTFGGFLLLAGVLSDRYGRKLIFCIGMALLSIWTLADGFAPSFISLAIFRALQGLGAAMTVPSAVGLISNYFTAQDRTFALTVYASAGAVGFCMGLLFGGFLTSALGWRYIFYVPVAITGSLGVLGAFALPQDHKESPSAVRPKLDLAGAALSTAGLVLLSFVLSSGGEYGWDKAFIIVLLVLSIALLAAFTYVEHKVASNPIMPLALWKLDNFAALWVGGFVMYGAYQTVIYYSTLLCQEVSHLSAGETALRFLPMGATGFAFSLAMSRALEWFNAKWMLVVGMAICAAAPLPTALMPADDDLSFWRHVFPTSVMSVAGTTIVFCTITVVLLASVPVHVKSLCGGMVNTAFQIGSGVGLALSSAVVQAVDTSKGHSELRQYETGMWCCVGLAGVGMLASLFGVKDKGKHASGPVMVH